MAEQFNTKYFAGMLVLGQIEFKLSAKMTRCLGKFSVHRRLGTSPRQSITVSSDLFLDPAQLANTIVHEMVHAWQLQTGRALDHGQSFVLKAKAIEAIDPSMVIERACSPTDMAANLAEAIVQKTMKKLSRQYLVTKPGPRVQINFITNLTRSEIVNLKTMGYKVVLLASPALGFRNCKNFESLVQANYSYVARQVAALTGTEL